jgi:hypothetical protein
MLEKIPFLHRGNAYNIIIDDDLDFDTLRFIIDRLIDMRAFSGEYEGAMQYSVECGDIAYKVGVEGNNVLIVLN